MFPACALRLHGLATVDCSAFEGGQILERDVAFISIIEGSGGNKQAVISEGSEGGPQSFLHVNFRVHTADVQDAQDVASQMASPDFAAKVSPRLLRCPCRACCHCGRE
jgi:hypothetical protein